MPKRAGSAPAGPELPGVGREAAGGALGAPGGDAGGRLLCRIVVFYDPAQLSPNQRLHWAEKARRAGVARRAAHTAWNNAGRPVAVSFPVRVEATIRRGRTLDADNAASSLKNLADGLFEGLVPDDSPRYVTWMPVRQETGQRHAENPHVEFSVWEPASSGARREGESREDDGDG